MKIDLSIFSDKPGLSFELYIKLNEEVFLKSQIDIVYTDYINWERNGILLTSSDKEKGTQNLISRKDYLWCKLVEQLRRFNVSIKDIAKLKSEWIDTNLFDETKKLLNTKKSVREDVKNLLNLSDEEIDQINDSNHQIHIDAFDVFIIESIINRKQLHLDFIYEDGEIVFLPRSADAYKELSSDLLAQLSQEYNNHYVSISITKLIESISITKPNQSNEFINQILTKDEHKLLYEIRRNTKSVKEIRLKFKKGEVNLLEIDNWKKVQLETKVLDLYNSKDYKNLELKIENGEVRAVIETTKIKM